MRRGRENEWSQGVAGALIRGEGVVTKLPLLVVFSPVRERQF